MVAAEVKLLRAAGHHVELCEVTNPEGHSAIATFLHAPWNRAAARPIVQQMRIFGPDVVHVHNTWFALSLSIVEAVRADGIPIVMTLHNYRAMCVDGSLLREGVVCTDCVGSTALRGVLHGCYRASRAASSIAALTLELANRRDVPYQSLLKVFLAERLAQERQPQSR